MAQVIVLAKGSLTAPLQPDDSGEPSGAGAELTLLHERWRVSPANFVLIAILFSWLRAKVFELLSLLNVQSAEQLQLPKNARQVYPVIRLQKIGEILLKDLSS